MENEQVYENSFISSNDVSKPRRQPSTNRQKVIISVDNLRCTAYKLTAPDQEEEDPDLSYTEDTYEIIAYWPARVYEDYSKTDLEIVDQIKATERGESNFVEFRVGTYTAQSTWSRKRFARK